MKQSAQSLLGYIQGRGKVASGLFKLHASQRPSGVVESPLGERRTLLRQLARGLPKPVDNLEPLPNFPHSKCPFQSCDVQVFRIFPRTDSSVPERTTDTRLPLIRHLADPPGDQ